MSYTLFTALPGLVVIFWIILFFVDEKTNIAKKVFVFLLFIVLLDYTLYLSYFKFYNKSFYLIESFSVFTSLSIFPIYYYYLRLLTTDLKIDYRWLWILLPGFALGLFTEILYFMMNEQEIGMITKNIMYNYEPQSNDYPLLVKLQVARMIGHKVLFVVQVGLTAYFGLRLLKKFKQKTENFYSNTKHLALQNIRVTLFFMAAIAILSSITMILQKDIFDNNHDLIVVPSLLYSLIIFGVCYAAYKQSFSIRELAQDEMMTTEEAKAEQEEIDQIMLETSVVSTIETDKNLLTDPKYDELYYKMEHLLNKELLFKETDLSLKDLATKLGTNRTYVSRIINEKANTNFSDYINTYRIVHAKELLSADNDEQMSINEISTAAGFSNIGSFYRIFSKKEKTTPLKYRKRFMAKYKD